MPPRLDVILHQFTVPTARKRLVWNAVPTQLSDVSDPPTTIALKRPLPSDTTDRSCGESSLKKRCSETGMCVNGLCMVCMDTHEKWRHGHNMESYKNRRRD